MEEGGHGVCYWVAEEVAVAGLGGGLWEGLVGHFERLGCLIKGGLAMAKFGVLRSCLKSLDIRDAKYVICAQ